LDASVQLEQWLSAANLPDDGRLPSERALADRLGLNRTELRKALLILEKNGRIVRHVGRGTFLKEIPQPTVPQTREIALNVGPLEAMEARQVIEPEIAVLASFNATKAQIARMKGLNSQMRNAHSWAEYEELDWQFHNLLGEACGNRLLFELQAILNSVRRVVIWDHLRHRIGRPEPNYHSFEEHEAIVGAIEQRDSRAAKTAMERHLRRTITQLQQPV
jgi:DNA-binding FadR family transcriptional regulator